MPEAIFEFGATSTMAPCNSMRTKTWSFEKTIFPLRFGPNGRGVKAHSRSQRLYEPQTKTIWREDGMRNIVHTLFHFSQTIYYLI